MAENNLPDEHSIQKNAFAIERYRQVFRRNIGRRAHKARSRRPALACHLFFIFLLMGSAKAIYPLLQDEESHLESYELI
jgi:hypothetical protein